MLCTPSLTNGWYFSSNSGSCTQGRASNATATLDTTAPTATLTGAPTGTDNTTTLWRLPSAARA